MELRTILAAVSGGSASVGAIEVACQLARQFNSHVEAFHVQLDPREIAMAVADPFGAPAVGMFIDEAVRQSVEIRAKARAVFDDAVKRHELPIYDRSPSPGSVWSHRASAGWREDKGYSPTAVASRARLFDLLVLGRSGRVVDQPYSDSIEQALLASGRPVLIAPAKPPSVLGATIAVAWNDTPESAKALAAAMPFLVRAQRVFVLSVGPTAAAELAEQLAWYGIRATADAIDAIKGVGPGEAVLAAARDRDADLLVMGGYGRTPWRELLFGGATREVVGTSLLPVLLAH
jgi:nucleotide-binding universal stress UspA family protein